MNPARVPGHFLESRGDAETAPEAAVVDAGAGAATAEAWPASVEETSSASATGETAAAARAKAATRQRACGALPFTNFLAAARPSKAFLKMYFTETVNDILSGRGKPGPPDRSY